MPKEFPVQARDTQQAGQRGSSVSACCDVGTQSSLSGEASATEKELEAIWPPQGQEEHSEVGNSRQEALGLATVPRSGRDNQLRVGLQVDQELLPQQPGFKAPFAAPAVLPAKGRVIPSGPLPPRSPAWLAGTASSCGPPLHTAGAPALPRLLPAPPSSPRSSCFSG